jgi:lipopolysaccharide assembly outer membrane protein LptD (OstA)
MKYILLTLLVFVSLLSNAQFARGDKFIGGHFSFSTQQSSGGLNDSESKNTWFELSPSVGFFLNDKFAVGGRVAYSSNRQKNTDDFSTQEYKSHSVSIGAFVKRYFAISDNFFFVLSGNANYGRGVQVNESGGSEIKTKGHNIGMYISPSLLFFPSSKWGIEASIGSLSLNHYRDLSHDSKNTSFNVTYGTFSLGFAYYLRK